MAADAPPTAYKEAPSLTEWDSLPEEDKIKQQEEMTKFLQEHDTTEKFIEECKKIGRTAAIIDGDFRTAKNGFAKLSAEYGVYFPNVINVYVPRWDGFMARWNGPTGLLLSSKNLAVETVGALFEYGEILARIADIQTQSQLEGAQNALRAYVDKHPISVVTQVVDGFKNLGIDLQDFSDDFKKYAGSFSASSSVIISLEASIKSIIQYQVTITDLNEKIQKSAMALGCSSVFGILSDIPVGSIGQYVVQRNEAQTNLSQTKFGAVGKISDTLLRIFALKSMQADFEKLKPGIVNICHELSSFASVWAFATEQAIEINVALNEGMEVLTRKKFQLKLALLIVQLEPLREGLKIYAAQI